MRCFSGSGNALFVGGVFGAAGCLARTNLAAFDLASGQVTAWNPRTDSLVLSLAILSNTVYVAGEFTNVNGVSRLRLAAVDPTSGTLTAWNPNANGFVSTLATWSNRLYAGGGFTTIGSTAQTNLAEFDLATGTLTTWNPQINRSSVRTLAVSSNLLYGGGSFTIIGGVTHRLLAAFDLTSHTLTSWDPGFTGSGYVDTVYPYGDKVYAGGHFSALGAYVRSNFMALDAATAQVLNLMANPNTYVHSIVAVSNLVFVGGDFTTMGLRPEPRAYVGALDITSGGLVGSVTSWDPSPDTSVQKLALIKGVLYIGGSFLVIGNQTSAGIAAFPLSPIGPLAILLASARRLTNGSFQFGVMAAGMTQATVQASTNLIGWQSLQTIPLVGGYGAFTDSNAPTIPRRFYRVSVP